MKSAFDEADVAGARPFLGILRSKFHALTLAEQLEHCAADRAAMEEVLDPTLVADEAEPFVDQEPCNCAGWHWPKPSVPKPQGYPKEREFQPLALLENGVSLGRSAPEVN